MSPASPPPKKLRVAVLFGGRSAEHEISLLSARFVVESLDPERFLPLLVGIDKSGRWRAQGEPAALGPAGSGVELDTTRPTVLLPPHPSAEGVELVEWSARRAATANDDDTAEPLAVGERAASPLGVDVVFPVLHGPFGEDGTVQGLLELAGVPYVGAGVLGSAVGMDKDVMKRLLRDAGLPVLPYRAVGRARFARERERVLADVQALALPWFVKPANLGSSVGVTRVGEPAELGAAVDHAFEFDDKIVIEAGLVRPREIECAVLGGEPPVVSVPGEITVDHPDGFYSYAAKYLDEHGASLQIPARLSDAEAETARRLAAETFAALECAGMARVDLFLDAEGRFWVNEINTIPGFTAISMFPKLMAASGVAARQLVSRLIDDALARAAEKRRRRTSREG